MHKYIADEYDVPFVLFSSVHIITLLIIFFTILFIFYFRVSLRKSQVNTIVRYLLASILIISEISLAWWLFYIEAWDISTSLPLHISSISLLLSAILLMTKSYRVFEITYFIGVGSALHAIFTPDISGFSFPHFRYVHFFISHGGIVIANMFILIVHMYKPTIRSLFRAFAILNIYMIFILIFNKLVNGNYLYISKKPVNPSIIDYLGPWPWYIISLEVLAIVTFFLLYTPFYFINRKGNT
ncbi:TIGR02206 family membrane protein [Lottiidibacillus patelloidae]|uniref:TIGR02206 family membrane protein n=1 Tax=Lottiidibacillus patelloidae TaxID=2670334 RepID=A0A263BUF5_9BACI|nr:TIGR02206 family membrane protein [Lottiidibacillus patelloidae]OZM57340.1 TIGR02206 family membrane protein [Lottiidibacillus patelloidae]